MSPRARSERIVDVPDKAVGALEAVLEDFSGLPGPPGGVRFYGPRTDRFRRFVAGEGPADASEILGVTDTHSFRAAVGDDPAALAVAVASVLQDDVMDELGAPWPEVPLAGGSETCVLEPELHEDLAVWRGGGHRCPIGQLNRTFGNLLAGR